MSMSISCAEHIAHVQGIRNAHKMLVRIPGWKRLLENHRYNCGMIVPNRMHWGEGVWAGFTWLIIRYWSVFLLPQS